MAKQIIKLEKLTKIYSQFQDKKQWFTAYVKCEGKFEENKIMNAIMISREDEEEFCRLMDMLKSKPIIPISHEVEIDTDFLEEGKIYEVHVNYNYFASRFYTFFIWKNGEIFTFNTKLKASKKMRE